MSRIALPSMVAIAVAAFLASLSLVTWRQVRTLEVLVELEEIRIEEALATAEITELEQRIRYLESFGRVVPEARERLGMHLPDGSELVILPGEVL